MEVLDGNRVRITLGRAAPQYLQLISLGSMPVAHPRHLMAPRIEKGEVTISPLDVGNISTGPFKFVRWEPGSRAQVSRFDKYWEKDDQGRALPFLDGIEFALMREGAVQDAAFRVGQLDGGTRAGGYYLTPERKAAYVKDLGDKVWFAEIGWAPGNLSFNVLKSGPLQDIRVRRAISLWVDRDAFCRGLYGGFCTVGGPILHPKNPYTSPDFLTWPGLNPATRQQDQAEAKRLLAEAGYASGLKLTSIMPSPRWRDIADFYQGQLRSLGIELEIKLADEAGFASGRLTLDYAILHGYTFATVPDAAEPDLQLFNVSKQASAKHEDPKVAEFFSRLARAVAFEDRVKIWREFERYYILEKVYQTPMGGQISVVPYRSYVKGVFVPAERFQENLEFATVWLDK